MAERIDGRKNDQMREIKIKRQYISHLPGSVLIEVGKTRIICTANMEERVPPFLKGKGSGWITSEYDMIPMSSPQRIIRPQAIGRISGRTHEIQRLIGRSLRACVDLDALGERTIWVDCDVIEADGGTRTASITGGFIALFDCLKAQVDKKIIPEIPILSFVAAISVGIVGGEVMVDLCFAEDSKAEVDMNVVMNSKGDFIEVQATAESMSFSKDELDKMLGVSGKAIDSIIEMQKKIITQ